MSGALSFFYLLMVEVIDIKYKDYFVRIGLNTGESMNLDYDIFNIYNLEKGKIVDSVEYQQLKDEADRFACRQKALDYLSIRSCSSLEMENYLFRKDFSKDIIREVVKSLKESGYINDYNFAMTYINSKKKGKLIGENLLKKQLYKKGIRREIVKRAIAESGFCSVNLDELYRLALEKLKMLGDRRNKMSKLIFFLKQRGFRGDEVRSAIDYLKKEGYEL